MEFQRLLIFFLGSGQIAHFAQQVAEIGQSGCSTALIADFAKCRQPGLLHLQRLGEIAHAVEHVGKISQTARQAGFFVDLAIGVDGLLIILPRVNQISLVVIDIAKVVERSRDSSLIAQGTKHGEAVFVGYARLGEFSFVIEQMPYRLQSAGSSHTITRRREQPLRFSESGRSVVRLPQTFHRPTLSGAGLSDHQLSSLRTSLGYCPGGGGLRAFEVADHRGGVGLGKIDAGVGTFRSGQIAQTFYRSQRVLSRTPCCLACGQTQSILKIVGKKSYEGAINLNCLRPIVGKLAVPAFHKQPFLA